MSESSLDISGVTGKVRVTSLIPEGGMMNQTWYPHMYCINLGDYAFMITLYEYDLEDDYQDTHQGILQSLKLE